jgi:hypothetical protein
MIKSETGPGQVIRPLVSVGLTGDSFQGEPMYCARCDKLLPKIDMPTVPGQGPMMGIPGALPALQHQKPRKWLRLAPGTGLTASLGHLLVSSLIGCQ